MLFVGRGDERVCVALFGDGVLVRGEVEWKLDWGDATFFLAGFRE